MVSGADDFEEIETYGRRKESFLRGFLELPNGIPSHDTARLPHLTGCSSIWTRKRLVAACTAGLKNR